MGQEGLPCGGFRHEVCEGLERGGRPFRTVWPGEWILLMSSWQLAF